MLTTCAFRWFDFLRPFSNSEARLYICIISSFVIDELGHGVTVFDARGAYSNVKTKVLFTLIPTKEYYRFKEGIKTIDKEAFFTVLDAYEVLGGE